MSNKTLAILAVVAAVMVVWAVVQSKVASQQGAEPTGVTYLIQGLDPDDIGAIVLGAGEDEVKLERQGRGFVVTNKDNYPADISKINELITDCLKIQTSELVTSDPDNHEDLEVNEADARSVVKFLKADPNAPILAGVVIGKSREQGEGSYVRLLAPDAKTSNKVYIGSEIPWLNTGETDYIDKEITDIERDEIEQVTVASADETYTLRIKEPNSTEIMLDNMPEGKELKTSDAESTFTALMDLRFDDVRRAGSELNFDRRYVCKLKNSVVYTLGIAEQDEKTFVTCTAEYTGEVPKTVGKDDDEAELKKKEAKLLANDTAKEFAAKHRGWVYEIADYKAKYLKYAVADITEDIEEPNEPADTASTVTGEATVEEATTTSEDSSSTDNADEAESTTEPAEDNDAPADAATTPPADEPTEPAMQEATDPNTAGN